MEPTISEVIPQQQPKHDEFELEITNRFSDLDGDIEEGEAMDHARAESSPSGASHTTSLRQLAWIMDSLIQWNYRGLRHNCNELKLLLSSHSPIAGCLQETSIKNTNSIKVKHCTLYDPHTTIANGKPSGGVSILIKNYVPSGGTLKHTFTSQSHNTNSRERIHPLLHLSSTTKEDKCYWEALMSATLVGGNKY